MELRYFGIYISTLKVENLMFSRCKRACVVLGKFKAKSNSINEATNLTFRENQTRNMQESFGF